MSGTAGTNSTQSLGKLEMCLSDSLAALSGLLADYSSDFCEVEVLGVWGPRHF